MKWKNNVDKDIWQSSAMFGSASYLPDLEASRRVKGERVRKE